MQHYEFNWQACSVRARSRHCALPSACRVRWDQPTGWDRHCWWVVDIFELCLRDGRVDVRFGGELDICLRLRLD